ncbi:hypothetical protein QWI17_16955 [Gilvimarinus sp. SDUM040013]|uniref:Uncharacterized protein n=1 Tax=Gilvimarinus gilvus TaxID=3058038 RepID=A0ABU4S3K7_9GAMM|nr:DUF3592 domain-containing protein [Gilvimarinus sp. SDUM040013]MDO3387534.1 hypothetical protein [Gilvimarinus sp. SDUM040013]MDX6851524.1 hypothetical protein [Gilvimarinus sp. SDUM040013]
MAKKLAGFLLFLVGMLILAGGVWYTYEAVRFIATTESTTGKIVEHEYTGGSNAGFRDVDGTSQTTDMYAPIVEFRTPADTNVRFRANWSEGDPPAIGTTVPRCATRSSFPEAPVSRGFPRSSVGL